MITLKNILIDLFLMIGKNQSGLISKVQNLLIHQKTSLPHETKKSSMPWQIMSLMHQGMKQF